MEIGCCSRVPIVAIMRLVFVYLLFYSPLGEAPYFSMSFILSAVESNLAIACACAPTLWGLARLWFPSVFGNQAGVGGGGGPTRGLGMTARTSQTWRYSTQRYRARAADDVIVSGDGMGGGGEGGGPICGTGSSHVEAAGLGGSNGGGRRLGLTPSEEEIMVNYGIVQKGEGGEILGPDMGGYGHEGGEGRRGRGRGRGGVKDRDSDEIGYANGMVGGGGEKIIRRDSRSSSIES